MDVRLVYKLDHINVDLKEHIQNKFPTLECIYYTNESLASMFEIRLEKTSNAYLPIIIHNVNQILDKVCQVNECMIHIFYHDLYEDIKSRSDVTVAMSWITKDPPTSFEHTCQYGSNGPYLGTKTYLVEHKHVGRLTKEWLRQREADHDLLAPYTVLEGPRFEVIDYIIKPKE